MLTPQDIQNKEFVKAVFGGYDMQGVDDFLEELTDDYAALYKENAILKSKIKVLVEKVEEYRSTEDAMRMALLTAQKMGDELLDESKKKSNSLLEAANAEAKQRREELDRAIVSENERLRAAKQKTAQFIQSAKLLTEKYTDFLANLDEMDIEVPEEAPEEAAPVDPRAAREEEVSNTVREIDNNVLKMLNEEEESQEAEPDEPQEEEVPEMDDEGEPTKLFRLKGDLDDEMEEDEVVTPRPKFDFEDLKFGTNYREEED